MEVGTMIPVCNIVPNALNDFSVFPHIGKTVAIRRRNKDILLAYVSGRRSNTPLALFANEIKQVGRFRVTKIKV